MRHLFGEALGAEDLALLGGALGGLLQLLLGAGDFGVNVDAARDFEQDGGGGAEGEDGAAGGGALVGAQDGEVVESFAGEGLDGGLLVGGCLVRLFVVALDKGCDVVSFFFFFGPVFRGFAQTYPLRLL